MSLYFPAAAVLRFISSRSLVTIPVPIVLPLSLIVNRWPISMGMPALPIQLRSTEILSPGMTISISLGRRMAALEVNPLV